ncbi:MAG: M20/M25/M40 family metallo-hydrolase [Proteobacteria bacterium]|nr:M20/M25/M40 family metallo-hydrolase [Pseudomonadota bacterium]
MLKTALSAAALFIAQGTLAAGLSASQSRVAAAVDAGEARNEALLEKLVNINSGSFNPAGVQSVARELESELKSLDFEVTWVNEDAVKRAPSLLATHRGGRGKRVLLLGHMDTVFELSHPFQRMTREGKRVAGPGVNDMKGGLVVIIGALRALHQAGTLKNANVTVFLTGDEEAAGDPITLSRKDLIAAAKTVDAALSFEGLVIVDGQEYASTARRGSAQWILQVKATAAHSGGIFSPGTGDGAGFELARVLSQFHDTLREPNMTYSVGLMLAGAQIQVAPDGQASVAGKDNIIPPEGYASGDLRVLSPEQLERVHGKMRDIVAHSLPGTTSTIAFEDTYPPMAPTPGNAAILDTLNDVNASLGAPHLNALDPMKRGAGDASFIAPYVDVLDGLGMPGEGSHTAAETADLSYLPLQCKRAALLIMALSSQRPRR